MLAKKMFSNNNLILALLSFVATISIIFTPLQANAQISPQIKRDACQGVRTSTSGNCDASAANSVSSLLSRVIELLSWIVGVVSIIMVIVGGFKFIVSSGDPAGAKSAKNTVIYALVGLAVAALAQVLVRFVLSQV